MSDYKITRVSQDPPREWQGPSGTLYYHKVRVEGWDKPISVGKRVPNSLHAGDVISGTITVDAGHPEDKFKAESKPFGGGGSQQSFGSGGTAKPAWQPKDEHAIARAVALKAAVELYAHSDEKLKSNVLTKADEFLGWLEAKDKTPEKSSVEQFTGKDEPHYENDMGDEPVNLADIPF